MINIDSQRREFAIVISDISRCHGNLKDLLDYVNNRGYEYFIIKHDKDIDSQGELIRPHWHIVISSIKRLRVKQVLNELSNCLITNLENIQIQEVLEHSASVQYLIHKNNLEKYQYSINDIITNSDNLIAIMNETIANIHVSTDWLIDNIIGNSMTRLELIKAIGIGAYTHYRPVINDLYNIADRRIDKIVDIPDN